MILVYIFIYLFCCRFETRPAAEEIIERLHGRVVRGWNDNGSRISVRFADSNEQRELRVPSSLNFILNNKLTFFLFLFYFFYSRLGSSSAR